MNINTYKKYYYYVVYYCYFLIIYNYSYIYLLLLLFVNIKGGLFFNYEFINIGCMDKFI